MLSTGTFDTLVVAGALKYSQYGRLKRLLIRWLAGRHPPTGSRRGDGQRTGCRQGAGFSSAIG